MLLLAISGTLFLLSTVSLVCLYNSRLYQTRLHQNAKCLMEILGVFLVVSSFIWTVLLVLPPLIALSAIGILLGAGACSRFMRLREEGKYCFFCGVVLASLFCALANAIFDLAVSDIYFSGSDVELIKKAFSHALRPTGLLMLSVGVVLARLIVGCIELVAPTESTLEGRC